MSTVHWGLSSFHLEEKVKEPGNCVQQLEIIKPLHVSEEKGMEGGAPSLKPERQLATLSPRPPLFSSGQTELLLPSVPFLRLLLPPGELSCPNPAPSRPNVASSRKHVLTAMPTLPPFSALCPLLVSCTSPVLLQWQFALLMMSQLYLHTFISHPGDTTTAVAPSTGFGA